MNLLYVTTFLHFGAGRALLDLAKEAKIRGHDATIVATEQIEQYYSQHNLISEAEHAGIKVILCKDLFTRNYAEIRQSSERIIKLFNNQRFDIIHSHAAVPGFAAALSSKCAYGILLPHISTVHAWGPNKSDWMKLQDVLFLNSVNIVHSVSSDVSKYLVSEGVHEKIIRTVYNGCNFARVEKLSKQNAERKYPKKRSFRIGTVADLTERKGIKYLLDAIAKLSLQLQNHLEVLIIGEGEEKHRLIEQAEKLGLNNIVEFIGFEANPFKYMVSFDLFILPSLSEGLPVTLVEAMYLKIPIITTDVQGNREIAGENRGVLVPAYDSAALAKQIEHLFTNRMSYIRITETSYDWVVSAFSRQMAFDRVFNLYNECL